jgi:hypothetical protein
MNITIKTMIIVAHRPRPSWPSPSWRVEIRGAGKTKRPQKQGQHGPVGEYLLHRQRTPVHDDRILLPDAGVGRIGSPPSLPVLIVTLSFH